MSRLREPKIPSPVPARTLAPGKILVSVPGGRTASLTGEELAALASGRMEKTSVRQRLEAAGLLARTPDVEALALDECARGRLNWAGPATHVVHASSRGDVMRVETAQAVVDFALTTPHPRLTLEIVDEDGLGWPAAWFAVAYARRRAEWAGRDVALCYRTPRAPSDDRLRFLRGYEAVVRADLRADGAPHEAVLFPARRARVAVGPGAESPEEWVDRLAAAGIRGVEWVPAPAAESAPGAARRCAVFVARALARMMTAHEGSLIHDELAVALLSGRPWEVPGVDLASTLAYSPGGEIFSSEIGLRLAAEEGNDALRLGTAAELHYEDLAASPIVRALAVALAQETQPLCASCVYSSYCVIAPSAHLRAQGTLHGRLPDSPRCAIHMALLDAFFRKHSVIPGY